MAKKSGKNVYLVALLLFLGGVGYLAYSGVAEDGLSRSETGRDVKFRLEDQENKATTLWVEYTGAIPDTFKAGAEVIVEGGLRPDGSFQAKTLMTKCPSKYQKENRG